MDAFSFWVGNTVTRHIATHLNSAMPVGLWLLAHELTVVIVRGEAKAAESQGGVTITVPDRDDPDLLAEAAREALDQLQDLIASLTHRGWPGDGGLLTPTADVRDAQLLLGYLRPGVGWDDAADRDLVLPPLPLPTDSPRVIISG